MKGICTKCNTILEGKDIDELADNFTNHNELEHRNYGIVTNYKLLKDNTYLFRGLNGLIIHTNHNDLRGYEYKYRKEGPILSLETGFGLIDYMVSQEAPKKIEMEEEYDQN